MRFLEPLSKKNQCEMLTVPCSPHVNCNEKQDTSISHPPEPTHGMTLLSLKPMKEPSAPTDSPVTQRETGIPPTLPHPMGSLVKQRKGKGRSTSRREVYLIRTRLGNKEVVQRLNQTQTVPHQRQSHFRSPHHFHRPRPHL